MCLSGGEFDNELRLAAAHIHTDNSLSSHDRGEKMTMCGARRVSLGSVDTLNRLRWMETKLDRLNLNTH